MPGIPADRRMQLELAKGERNGPGKREFVCVWWWGVSWLRVTGVFW